MSRHRAWPWQQRKRYRGRHRRPTAHQFIEDMSREQAEGPPDDLVVFYHRQNATWTSPCLGLERTRLSHVTVYDSTVSEVDRYGEPEDYDPYDDDVCYPENPDGSCRFCNPPPGTPEPTHMHSGPTFSIAAGDLEIGLEPGVLTNAEPVTFWPAHSKFRIKPDLKIEDV